MPRRHRLFKEDHARAVDWYIDFFGGADRSAPSRTLPGAPNARCRKAGVLAVVTYQAGSMRRPNPARTGMFLPPLWFLR